MRVPRRAGGRKKERKAQVAKPGKRPSKKAWRKADVEDVEETMEDERLVAKLKKQAMKGSNKDQDDLDALFTVDTKGSCEGLSQASRKEVARAKIFREKGPDLGLSGFEEAKVARAAQTLENRQRQKPKANQEVFDLWSTPTKAERWKAERADEEVGAFRVRKQPKPTPIHTPRTLHQKASRAPAVVPAHEGQSMNPGSEAYEDLACMAAAKQLEKEEKVESLERQMRPITTELRATLGDEEVAKMDEATRIQTYRKLICPGAPEPLEGESEEAFEKRIAKFRRKSQSKRNKERKRKITDHKQAQLQAQKKLDKSVGEVGAILKEMNEEEETRRERRAYRESLRRKRRELEETVGTMDAKTRLGRGKAPEEDLAVPDLEATGQLRKMPIKASAVRDRLSSILRRGLLPSRPETALEATKRRRRSLKAKHKRKMVSPLLRDNMVTRKNLHSG